MRTTDEAGNPYTTMLDFPVTEFARLQAAVADRAPDLRLHLTRAYGDSGPHVVEVMAPGVAPGNPWEIASYLTRHQHGWHIHDPAQGPAMDSAPASKSPSSSQPSRGSRRDGTRLGIGGWRLAGSCSVASEGQRDMLTNSHSPLPISPDDLLRLKAAVGDRDRNLRLVLGHTDEGEDFVSVMTKGFPDAIASVIRSEYGWLVHHPEDGPLYEFRAIPEVANFLALGDTKCCRRNWMKAPWRKPTEPPKWVPGVGR